MSAASGYDFMRWNPVASSCSSGRTAGLQPDCSLRAKEKTTTSAGSARLQLGGRSRGLTGQKRHKSAATQRERQRRDWSEAAGRSGVLQRAQRAGALAADDS
jgi:hypothetical protein